MRFGDPDIVTDVTDLHTFVANGYCASARVRGHR
jgi:hypothetical protein